MPDADPHTDAIANWYAAKAIAATGCNPDACEPTGMSFGASQYDLTDFGGAPTLSLGCANPLRVAELRAGETVLDLGSGAGLDLLLSARRVGPTGRVIGLDMTEEMVELAGRTSPTPATSRCCSAGSSRSRSRTPPSTSSSPTAWSTSVRTSPPYSGRSPGCSAPGGRLGISDLVTADDADPDRVAAAAAAIGTRVRPLSITGYEEAPQDAGLADIRIEPTHGTGGGIHATTVRAVKPKVIIRPMAPEDWPAVSVYERDRDSSPAGGGTWWCWSAEARLRAMRSVSRLGSK